jgi:hypothetical protein
MTDDRPPVPDSVSISWAGRVSSARTPERRDQCLRILPTHGAPIERFGADSSSPSLYGLDYRRYALRFCPSLLGGRGCFRESSLHYSRWPSYSPFGIPSGRAHVVGSRSLRLGRWACPIRGIAFTADSKSGTQAKCLQVPISSGWLFFNGHAPYKRMMI